MAGCNALYIQGLAPPCHFDLLPCAMRAACGQEAPHFTVQARVGASSWDFVRGELLTRQRVPPHAVPSG